MYTGLKSIHKQTIPPPAPPPKRAPIFLGKIIPNIGDYDFEADEGPSDTDTDETFFSYGTPTSETSSLPIPGKPIPILDLDKELPKLPTLEEASRPTELIECVTALSPPPLHHSRKTRSKVVFVPRDAPGTCP
ncbi:hypothetical protein H0H93_011872 [Arthromyces matolae]|nr:hypothetical protein H0H93_011872 [Arthromyces matolae]